MVHLSQPERTGQTGLTAESAPTSLPKSYARPHGKGWTTPDIRARQPKGLTLPSDPPQRPPPPSDPPPQRPLSPSDPPQRPARWTQRRGAHADVLAGGPVRAGRHAAGPGHAGRFQLRGGTDDPDRRPRQAAARRGYRAATPLSEDGGMPILRIALAQVDSTVGDLPGNADTVRAWTRRAAEAGAHLVSFPEIMLTGYPVEDLVFRESFVAASRTALRALAADLATEGLGDVAVVVGYLDADGPARLGADAPPDRGPRDALALLHGGRIVATYFKHHLPNYGVFDEDRYFVPGDTLRVVRIGGVDVALTVCEDIWQAGGPFAVARSAGVGLVVNINASPYEMNKDDVRRPLVARRAREAGAAVAYVNLVGGQDELVFDGDSLIVAKDGELLARSPQFAEHLLVHDLELPGAGEADDEIDSDVPPEAMRVG